MRRQVKPFVTEYRGAVRRHKDHTGSVDQPQEASATRSRPSSEAQRAFASDVQDTSYEAALRAADALFAQPSERKAIPQAVSPEPDPWTKPATAASPRVVVEAQPFDDPIEAYAPIADDDKGAASQGRILQAIEPPEADRFAALEAERAPKRRGRKPGSKNKPKPGVADDWAATTREPIRRADAETPAPSLSEGGGSVLDHSIVDEVQPLFAAEGATLEDDLLPIGDLPAAAGRARNDRFGWKRTSLRPGERWKRRLPRTAW